MFMDAKPVISYDAAHQPNVPTFQLVISKHRKGISIGTRGEIREIFSQLITVRVLIKFAFVNLWKRVF